MRPDSAVLVVSVLLAVEPLEGAITEGIASILAVVEVEIGLDIAAYRDRGGLDRADLFLQSFDLRLKIVDFSSAGGRDAQQDRGSHADQRGAQMVSPEHHTYPFSIPS